jgi:hypothetical protein
MAEFAALDTQFDANPEQEVVDEEAVELDVEQVEEEDWTDDEVEEEWNNMPKPVDEEHNAILASFESLRQIEDVAQVPITARRSTHHPPMHHQHLCRAIGDGGVWMVPHVVQASEAPRDRGLTESRSRRPRSRVEHGSEGLASQGCSGLASNQIEAISWRS